jgi:protein arginine kinase activator
LDLKEVLKVHIDQEEFEKAAEVRDKVRSLEKRYEAQEGGEEL